jgi:hypothetical protein
VSNILPKYTGTLLGLLFRCICVGRGWRVECGKVATLWAPLSGLLDSYARLEDKIFYNYTGALLGLLFRCICVGRGSESGVWLMVIGDTIVGMS